MSFNQGPKHEIERVGGLGFINILYIVDLLYLSVAKTLKFDILNHLRKGRDALCDLAIV